MTARLSTMLSTPPNSQFGIGMFLSNKKVIFGAALLLAPKSDDWLTAEMLAGAVLNGRCPTGTHPRPPKTTGALTITASHITLTGWV